MRTLLRRLIHEEDGQDLIEYALLAALISLAAVAALLLLGPKINTLFQQVNTQLSTG